MPESTPTALPMPSDYPERAVVIYDGDCRFCLAQVRRIARWDTRDRFAFISLHEPEVNRRWPALTYEELMARMYVIPPQGAPLGGAAAFRYISRQVPRLWLLMPLMHVPGSLPLWEWCYGLVARWRYRLAGKTGCDDDACQIHFSGRSAKSSEHTPESLS